MEHSKREYGGCVVYIDDGMGNSAIYVSKLSKEQVFKKIEDKAWAQIRDQEGSDTTIPSNTTILSYAGWFVKTWNLPQTIGSLTKIGKF